MTLGKYLALVGQVDRLRTARALALFEQNVLKPLMGDTADNRVTDLARSVEQKRRYLLAGQRR